MSNLSDASRPIMWNIDHAWVMYLLLFVALGVFAFGVYRLVNRWRSGRPANERLGDWGPRLWAMLKDVVAQVRTRRAKLPGFFHSLVFYSFAVLLLTTTIVAFDYDLGTDLFHGWLYIALTVGAELGGVLILVGLAMAAWRRSVEQPKTLSTTAADWWSLAILALIVVTGFLAEGLRIAALGDPWAKLTPVGGALASAFSGLSTDTLRRIHSANWWTHTVLALSWVALIPYTKFAHLLVVPANIYFQKRAPRGQLQREDMEEIMSREDFDFDTFKVGVETADDFTWKQRLDFDACLSCGRCEEVCPAVKAGGSSFSPKAFIARCLKAVDQLEASEVVAEGEKAAKALVGSVLDEDFVWHCRTCMACTEVCPVAIDHVDTLMEVRRNETLMQARLPTEASRTLKLLEKTGNPFGPPQSEREEWIRQAGIRTVAPGEHVDVLLWIGCSTTFDPTKHEIAQDLCTLLTACGIDYGVLGSAERCCGDPARLMGEERLFQEIAKAQIAAIKERDFRVLLTACPHCYNVFANEYPKLGGDFNVVHHTQFLHEMLYDGVLTPEFGKLGQVTFHDPCYLGRYQGVYDAPREVLKAVPGVQLLEMEHNQAGSMCCGGGGGHFWMDLPSDDRINNLRVQEAKDTGASAIVTACPFCNHMLEDSVKTMGLEDELEVTDLVTVLLKSIPETQLTHHPAAARAKDKLGLKAGASAGGGRDSDAPQSGDDPDSAAA